MPRLGRRLARSFYARDVLDVCPDLLGKHVQHEGVVLRITEVEAYKWPPDTACHARSGRTPRTAPIWGPPGRAYVYLCYGLHQMLNIVTGADGQAQAILVRACEPVRGMPTILARRGSEKEGPILLTGPGKVGQALALDTSWSHHCLHSGGGLTLHEAPAVARVATGPRIGIDYAEPEHRDLPWRFADADSLWVTHRRKFTGS